MTVTATQTAYIPNFTPGGLPGAYINSANATNTGLNNTNDLINGLYVENAKAKNNIVNFTRKTAQKVAQTLIPGLTPEDKILNKHFADGPAMDNLYFLHGLLMEMANRDLSLIWRKDKLPRAWEKLKNCDLNNDNELREALKLGAKGEESAEELKGAKQAIQLFKDIENNSDFKKEFKEGGTSFDKVLITLGERSGFRAIRDFAILPFVGSGAFNLGRYFMDAGFDKGAQAAFLGGTALTSAPSFLIADSVVKHLDYKNITNPYVKALVPFVKLGTILSHTISPILNMAGIAFDFDGMVKGKSNAFGKVNNFLTTGLDLLRPLSMLGFALGHVSGLNHAHEKFGIKDGNKKDIFGNQKYKAKPGSKNYFKFTEGFEQFGFYANMVGFAFWGIGQIASLVIDNHEKKVNKMFEPIIEELQQRMAAEQEMLKQAVIAGKISKEEAIKHLEEAEKTVQGFIQEKLLPAYDAQMKGWKTASWLVNVINWASFLGVSVQMYTGSYRNLGAYATRHMDGDPAKGIKPVKKLFRMPWSKDETPGAFNLAMNDITQGDRMKTFRTYAGLTAGPLALFGGSFVEGFNTVFGPDSPFHKLLEGSRFAKNLEDINKSPLYNLLSSLAMFS